MRNRVIAMYVILLNSCDSHSARSYMPGASACAAALTLLPDPVFCLRLSRSVYVRLYPWWWRRHRLIAPQLWHSLYCRACDAINPAQMSICSSVGIRRLKLLWGAYAADDFYCLEWWQWCARSPLNNLTWIVSITEIQIVPLASSHQTTECGLQRYFCRYHLGKVLRMMPTTAKLSWPDRNIAPPRYWAHNRYIH